MDQNKFHPDKNHPKRIVNNFDVQTKNEIARFSMATR